MKAVIAVLVVVTAFYAAPTFASIAFTPTLSHISTSTSDANSTPESKENEATTYIDLRLGYLMPGGFYLGGIYGIDSGTGRSESTTTTDTDRSASRLGASVGFVMGGFNLLGHYFLTAQESDKRSSTVTDKYTEGSGMQLDIGWSFPLTGTILFGPQITWSNMTYKSRERTSGGATTTTTKDYNRTEIRPHLAFWFMF